MTPPSTVVPAGAVRFLRPVYPGDTLVAESEVIGLREVSSGEAGVVYVRTRGANQKGLCPRDQPVMLTTKKFPTMP